MDKDYLINGAAQVGTTITSEQAEALCAYYEKVVECNKAFNLTAITEEKDFAVKHIIDSLAGVSEIPHGAKLCDIGSGGGFPSMPIAIAREDVSVTALDSTAKKMAFVAQSANELGIKNISTIAGRAEEQKAQFAKYDAVTARAVSALPILLELAMPFLKVGGLFLAYKTDESELPTAQNAMKVLGVKHLYTKFLNLPNGDKRAIIVFEKIKQTPSQYPRVYGSIKKKPL